MWFRDPHVDIQLGKPHYLWSADSMTDVIVFKV